MPGYQDDRQKEKSTNCGTEAADVNIFGAFATNMTSQRLSLQSVAQTVSFVI